MISHLYSHEFIFDSTVNCEKKEGSYCAYTDVLWFTLGLKEIQPRTSNPYSVATRWMPMVDKPILTCPAKEAVFRFTICMHSFMIRFKSQLTVVDFDRNVLFSLKWFSFPQIPLKNHHVCLKNNDVPKLRYWIFVLSNLNCSKWKRLWSDISMLENVESAVVEHHEPCHDFMAKNRWIFYITCKYEYCLFALVNCNVISILILHATQYHRYWYINRMTVK